MTFPRYSGGYTRLDYVSAGLIRSSLKSSPDAALTPASQACRPPINRGATLRLSRADQKLLKGFVPLLVCAMPDQRDHGRDQVAVQAAHGSFAVPVFHYQDNGKLRGSLRDYRDALACQGGDGTGRTHGIHAESGANAGAGSQVAPAQDTPGSHVVLQERHHRVRGLLLNHKREMLAR